MDEESCFFCFEYVTGGFNAFKSVGSASMAHSVRRIKCFASKSLNEWMNRCGKIHVKSILCKWNYVALFEKVIELYTSNHTVFNFVCIELLTLGICEASTWTFRFNFQPRDLFACFSDFEAISTVCYLVMTVPLSSQFYTKISPKKSSSFNYFKL